MTTPRVSYSCFELVLALTAIAIGAPILFMLAGKAIVALFQGTAQ